MKQSRESRRHAFLWILTFVTLFKPFLLSQTRDKFLTLLKGSRVLLLSLRGPRFLLVPPVSTADPETCPRTLATRPQGTAGSSWRAAAALWLPASLHPSPRVPSLWHRACLSITCATLVGQPQHLVIWQAPEDTENLVSYCPSSVSLAVLLIQRDFFCI